MAQMVHAPAFTPAAFTADDTQGLRQDKVNRSTYDAQTVAHMLDSIESVLDNAEECTGLLPSLDQLSALAGMHPTAWKPKFKGIVDLLVGWHVDQGTSPAVRKRIGDVLSMFSKQWPDATEFGQDLLDFFIKDIEGAMVDPKITDKSKIGSVSSLMSQGNPSRMYTLQPDAIKVLLRQFENPAKSNSAWKEAVAFTKKLIAIAGADEDEMIRGVIATVFEQFIGAFGSMSLGPCLMAKMTDRSFDVSPAVGAAWRKVIFQSNPFALALECYNIHETDIVRALK
ncbi:Serine/threonine-protein kinase smg1, partial [Podila minutissima]